MIDLLYPSFDAIVFSGICCCIIREMMIFALPDDIAGPGGWLVDTGTAD